METNNEPMKRCKCCGELLPLSAFHHNCATKDGYANTCKSCVAKRQKMKRQDKAANVLRPVKRPGVKAILTLGDFSDDQIFCELRRRGFAGELRFAKSYTI